MADPFGQAATQAPQPMRTAFSKALSAAGFDTGVACGSGAVPVGGSDVTAGLDDAVAALAPGFGAGVGDLLGDATMMPC
jgi:hypothetical protein